MLEPFFKLSFFVGPPIIPESTIVYDEIHDYEELKQEKEEKRYENKEVVDKIYVSLKPVVMETIRDHIQSTVSVFLYWPHNINPKTMCLIFVKTLVLDLFSRFFKHIDHKITRVTKLKSQ